MSLDNERQAAKLGLEIKQLLENWPTDAGPEADKAIIKLMELKREINSYGFLIECVTSVNPKDLKVTATIIINKPRANMPPAAQAIYDEWFKKMNGLG